MTKQEKELRQVLAGLLRIIRHTRGCVACISPETAIDEPKKQAEWKRLEKKGMELLAVENEVN